MTQLQIIFLGTGGSWPTIKRNVSSIAVKRSKEIILFDCGEGTQRQFQQSELSYMQITSIFITHFHGDHFLGIPGLIQTMQMNDRSTPLHIYGPLGMKTLVHQLLNLGYFKPNFPIISHEVTNDDHFSFYGYSIDALQVDHTVPAFAYRIVEDKRPGKFNKPKALAFGIPEGPLFSRLQHGRTITLDDGTTITPDMVLGPPRLGRTIVYSGDTRPNDSMIEFCQNADILIHEATYESSFEELAFSYGHTTARQAASIALNAHVESLYLIHLSPRYLTSRSILDEARSIFPNSYVPTDFQKIIVSLKK